MNRPHFQKDVTDQEIENFMRPHIDDLMRRVTPRIRMKPHKDSADRAQTQKGPLIQNHNQKFKMTGEDKSYLHSIFDHPYLSVTRRADYLGLSSYMNNKLKKRALDGELAAEFSLNFGHQTRGTVKFFLLTPKGFQAIGKEPPKAHGYRCSPEHWFWQRGIRDHYESQGFPAEIEMELNGKRADVGVLKDGRHFAVEVGLTAKNEAVNAHKDLEAGFSFVLLACRNNQVKKSVERRIQESLDKASLQKVKVILLSEFSFVGNLIKC